MNKNFDIGQSDKLGLSVSYLLLCSILSMYNYNIAWVLALLGSFFISKFHYLHYCAAVLILLIRSQSDSVLSSSDLAGYLEIYNSIGNGVNPFIEGTFSEGEVLLQVFFWLLSRFIPILNIKELSFIFVLLFLLLFYPIARIFKKNPIISISLVLFVDTILVVHLFRQSISSLILLLGIMSFVNSGKLHKQKGMLLYLLAGFTHSTNLIFGIIGTLSIKISIKYLKSLLIICGIIGLGLSIIPFVEELDKLSYGVMILNKASYGFSSIESSTGGFRDIGLISAGLSLIVFSSHPLFRIYLFFAALAFLFYQVPILAPRIGLIATSIITGLPIGIFLTSIKKLIINLGNSNAQKQILNNYSSL